MSDRAEALAELLVWGWLVALGMVVATVIAYGVQMVSGSLPVIYSSLVTMLICLAFVVVPLWGLDKALSMQP